MTIIHGHRGWRGKYPENSIEGFVEAVNLGVHGIELDVVITADKQVLVSHEPWFDHLKCVSPDNTPIENIPANYNLYKLNYDQIKKYDCGSVFQAGFPKQVLSKTYKPLLTEVIDATINLSDNCVYNIEIKSEAAWVNEFQPDRTEYVHLVAEIIKKYPIEHRLLIQSFDPELLNIFHALYPDWTYALLVENEEGLKTNLSKLTFKPHYYNPEYVLISEELIKAVHHFGLKIFAWTVNNPKVAAHLIHWNIDGIITDYPELFVPSEKSFC